MENTTTAVQTDDVDNPWLQAALDLPEDSDPAEYEDNVIPFPFTKIGDAVVLGDLESPEAVSVLNSRATVSISTTAPAVPGNKWQAVGGTWGDHFLHLLTQHPEQTGKGGNAICFSEGQLSRKINDARFLWKVEKKMVRVHAHYVDVDGGWTVDAAVEAIRAAGVMAAIYTTHSNASKGTPGSERFRIITPLSEPFELGKREDDPEAWEERLAQWKAHYWGVVEAIIPEGVDVDVDPRGALASQMMYAPARPVGADYEHFIVAGAGLNVSTIPVGDPAKYKRKGASVGPRSEAGEYDGEPPILKDGFDLLSWHMDHGEYFDMTAFLEMVGWDVRGGGGDWYEMLCPNNAAHTDPEADVAYGLDGPDSDNGALIYCFHTACDELRTCNFLRMLEEQVELPDGYKSMSEVLCDQVCYPDSVDGVAVEVSRSDYVEEAVVITFLKSPKAVERAFAKLSDASTADHYAGLYAGVEKGGNTGKATAALDRLMRDAGWKGNDLRRLAARGREMLGEERAAYAAEKAEERRQAREDALDRDDLAVKSLDPAEPLGDTMEEALATLSHRFAPVDLGGKFRLVRKPDLTAFGSDVDSTIVVYLKQDFLDLHLDRQIHEGDVMVNPAKEFIETAKRKSGIVFAPPPTNPGPNDFNMYQGRKLEAAKGDWPILEDFIFRIVCRSDAAKYDWLMLWMAHMVQRPGEKPGTAVVCRGEGGTGKGTFGEVLAQLTRPHFKLLENEKHVIGQFAGEHLSKCILSVVNEAVFGPDPKVSSALKSMADSPTMQVEAKGLNLVTVTSFLRLYFDTNADLPILIEGNGSERRWWVVEISSDEKQNLDYFAKVRAAINGGEMQALLHYLQEYDPANAGLRWDDVRTAPETEERRIMMEHSRSAPERRLQEVLAEGEVTLSIDGGLETFTADGSGLRVPASAFRDYIGAVGNKNKAADRGVLAMMARLFPDSAVAEGQGKVGSHANKRWYLFPPEVLGRQSDA
ncbi:primase-helicase family protein [Palleronia abyssalis]|uniref:NrS-1 polymerase-like helicase domain-containing protein n=1 Tax=Palleronia abyssalis TaxID=1501240 RepID=A0A2R8BY52_9RHOB|nr:primase-helicase family protein [Palleronia abyssalis]SPJ25053.1 hypothetical protein PAA8504_02896 [Palleronia abyssalis]